MDLARWNWSIFLMIGVLVTWRTIQAVSLTEEQTQTLSVNLMKDLSASSDPRIRPGIFGQPTSVLIDFYVQSFGPLNEQDMEFHADLDFRSTWNDNRLKFKSPVNDSDAPIFIPQGIEKFWIPDIYFPDEKTGTIHTITIPNKSMRIYPNGTVRYFTRFAMRVSCKMDLTKYPLDHQFCYIKISTYSYDINEVVLEWYDDDPIEMKEVHLPQFDIVDRKFKASNSCSEEYKTGNFSCLMAAVHLMRRPGFFILQSFIPSILIVMLSWVGFWVNKNSEPARVALGVTTVLTMTTQLTSAANSSVRVSYVKALDVWYATCMMFVFGALLEFAFVNVSSRSEKKHAGDDKKAEGDVEKAETGNRAKGRNLEWFRQKLVGWDVSAKNIDRVSRRAFPAAFIIFNFFYWIIYTNIPNEGYDAFVAA